MDFLTMGDWFTRAFGATVTDLRQKLVEEAWFGRQVTPRLFDSAGHGSDRDQEPEDSLAELLGWERDDTPERDEPDHDFER
jgi:hypothetical protein